MFRVVLGTVGAAYWFVRTGGRLRGSRFILRKPSRVKIARGVRVRVGSGCVIDRDARIVAQAPIVIGENVFIGKNSTLVAFAPLEIGARTLVAENVSIHTEDHGPVGNRLAYVKAPVTVGADCWLGAGAVVLKGVEIGDRTTVGALSLVSRSLPADVVAVGSPARVIRHLTGAV